MATRAERKAVRRISQAVSLGMKIKTNDLGRQVPPTDGEINKAFQAKLGK